MKRWIIILILLSLSVLSCNKYYVEISELTFDAVGEITYEVTNPTMYNLECEITFKNIGQQVFFIESNETQRYNYSIELPEEFKTSTSIRCKPSY